MKYFLISLLLLTSACTSYSNFTQLKNLPEPIIYSDEVLHSYFYAESANDISSKNILYVTDRSPATIDDREEYYKNERSSSLRVGLAQISPAKDDKEKSRVSTVKEFGFLANVLPYNELSSITDKEFSGITKADNLLTGSINNQLKKSSSKDLFVYVHGYKVVFENPLLITHELWRFMGHEGVFLAYAWPSTPKKLAYFKDIETAQLSGQNLRLLLEYIALNSDVERIHIIGYSAGTRVVITAIQQLALKHSHLSQMEMKDRLKIGNVILTASDYDISVFSAAIGNGLLRVPSKMTIYVSGSDKALGMSSWLFGQQRLGQFITSDKLQMNKRIEDFFINNTSLYFVDASNAESSALGNGHGYFINSPWVSSDILMLLGKSSSPGERGLVRKAGDIHWAFPNNYRESLRKSLEK